MSHYDPVISSLYDFVPVYASRTDVAFYVDEARAAGGLVLEVGCGTGRILVPTARAGIAIDGLDESTDMLAQCAAKLERENPAVRQRVTLHQSDARSFDLGKTFALVTAPFRVMQHQITIDDQLRFLASVRRHLRPGGRFVFDVFNPSFAALVSADGVEREDVPDTRLGDGRTFRRTGRVKRVRFVDQVSEVELIYYVSSGAGAEPQRTVQSFDMRWFLRDELVHLLARAGFSVTALYGDFDRSPVGDASKEIIVIAQAN
ncbi:MAG TPA: class I SAM-dependent methyltransferase [Gemmatimonadaceae bacterium]|nr:class I SAM-dependent methyltransferase [Gemmatimonadaceae bacterium]